MSEATATPSPGQIARVRQRLYLVEQTVAPPASHDSTLVRLSCVEDDNQGQPLEVLWEKEIDTEVLTGEAWDAIAKRGFDQAKLFSAYLNTLKWNCVTATDPHLFQSPFRAGIKLDAYQLEPLRKALLLPRVNLFIADDVGLGKTIEAGLIARELLLRKKAREILVCCPPSMLLQWQEELESRFGLTFEILDKDYVKRVRRERGFGVNPWSTHSRFLVSHRLLIDEGHTNPLIDWLGEFRPGSLLVLDEAHHAAPASGQRYAIDSQFTRAIRDVAPRFEHRLFLSATPHNGHSNSFSALLELLDPQRFCRGVPVTGKTLDAVMVRRLKDDLREIQGGFPKRNVVQVDIEGLRDDAPELRLFALLDQYRQLREERLSGETKRKQAAAGLLITGLQQRLLSSVEAFCRTLKVHRRTVQRQWDEFKANEPAESRSITPGLFDLITTPVGNDDDRAGLSEDELQAEEEAQIAAATDAAAGPFADKSAQAIFAKEQKLLDEMTELAETARAEPDARVRALVEWIRKHMCPGLSSHGKAPKALPSWNETRILIFTEYDDTKRYLVQQLSAAIQSTDRAQDRIAVFHGPTSPTEREAIKNAFNADPSKHPLRILIATDAAREGLNLQAQCWNLFHFDVPWNPSRLEQRNGRIDRKLQPKPEVNCHYFVYQQRPEDRILRALVRKTETIKRELGSLAQVIDARLADTLKLGIRRDQIEAIEHEIEAADLEADRRAIVEDELEVARQRQDVLRSQIESLRTSLDRSQKSIGLSKEHFRSAISCALELIGAPPLTAAKDNGGSARNECHFPALDQREGAGPTWADTMDSLRAPRSKDQKFWEWRRTSPIRPIVFEDTGTMDDGVVHLHLEHRVVQRLLGHFMAQGFVHHDLSRACFAHTSDAIPRVVLLGRLCLYGPGAARLHEELIPVTARWTDSTIRKGVLSPYARDAETKTMALLEQSLAESNKRAVTKETLAQLQAAAPRDVQELLPHLIARGDEYGRDAAKKLGERANAEAKAMQEILEAQKKHISTTVAKHDRMDEKQLRLAFANNEDELKQLEANRRYWDKRLDQRYGAWAQLLTLFRLIHDGGSHGALSIPGRRGYLFDPDRYNFLEGRDWQTTRQMLDKEALIPRVSDGVVYRVLNNLLILDGERLSYRTLDVEQIGSVYEAIMGFNLEVAKGRSIAIRPTKSHGAPAAINLDELLATPRNKRTETFLAITDRKLTGDTLKRVEEADSIEALLAALENQIARHVTPNLVPAGAMVFQPSDERRRSGSHYTPRSLTEPIVRTTLEPILRALADPATDLPAVYRASPEDKKRYAPGELNARIRLSEKAIEHAKQARHVGFPHPSQILDLKICDPAMGSGAFLVETCRQLGDELIKAWYAHNAVPAEIPPDEDEVLYARRLVAQRCLYGVDKNGMAVDLAKLALWLVTLAKHHPFTFLDHALRHGDSLVGLTRRQIVGFHWEPKNQKEFGEDLIQKRLERATEARATILNAREDVPYSDQEQRLAHADDSPSSAYKPSAQKTAVVPFVVVFMPGTTRSTPTELDCLA